MNFMKITTKQVHNYNVEDALDTLIVDGIWKCLETNSKEIYNFFEEMEEESCGLDDEIYYSLILPSSNSEAIRLSKGELFTFYNNEFIFIKDLIKKLEKELKYFKQLTN